MISKKTVNYMLKKERASYPKKTSKIVRDEDEILALTEVAKASVEKAKRDGRFVVTDKRKIYYDPS